ncbi:hypothetical protein HPB51_029794 [Rhipicephalus microplus]|uniref:YqaJ viral recombinase domain-containing protein n=1 Tax=Rhipicephalus microplus TaxID=6941 RepID=A0A9J6CTW7_RHIMP|nr:hypothetical protein HPB51_029794 [Rhipicephalus microplus]
MQPPQPGFDPAACGAKLCRAATSASLRPRRKADTRRSFRLEATNSRIRLTTTLRGLPSRQAKRICPAVSAADIYAYLIEGVCFYTREQFKYRKMGEAYSMFISGKVKQLKSFKAAKRGDDGDGVVLVAATVEASQTLFRQYQAWCVVKESGTVESAHSTCMAGIEVSAKYGLPDPSPTNVACKRIEASKRGKTNSSSETTAQGPARSARHHQLSAEMPLRDLHKNSHSETARKVQLTADRCCEIERATRDQAKSPRWLKERQGRITPSLLHRVAVCSTGATSLAAEIMGYIKTPQVANLRWGSEMEKKAKQPFRDQESPKHTGFNVEECWLVVAANMPFIGASPDGIVSCACCG